MMKIIEKDNRKENLEKPKIFEKEILFDKVGYPSDTQYFNYGVANCERYLYLFMAFLIFFYWGDLFFTTIFKLY